MLKTYPRDYAKSHFFIGGIFVLFLLLRIFAWQQVILFDELDSLGYLETIQTILQADLEKIIDLDADFTPGYPLFGAFFSLPGWGIETGARLTSLVFSCLVFFTLLGLGRHIARTWEVALGLIILSFSPILISHSYSVLSEPTYVGLVYLGLWLFWGQYKNPSLGKAALLGVTFGFAFLTRMEGILYLAIIPFLQGLYTLWIERNTRLLKHLISWSLIFVLGFAAIAVPQIWRVSEKMGVLALNGRQVVWTAILNNPDGKSYTEKINGLDFSPAQINIDYLKAHPEDLPAGAKNLNLYPHAYNVVLNFNELHQNALGLLIGPLCLIAFAFGLLSLFQAGYRFEAFLVLAFIVLNLVAPLMHNVDLRHILVIVPIMCLVAGIGIVKVSEVLIERYNKYPAAPFVIPVLFLCVLITAWAFPLRDRFKPPDYNWEYSPAEIKEPLRILNGVAKNQLGRVPIVVAERGYLTYYLGGRRLPLPYANYQDLVKYCELNEVEYAYLVHRNIRTFQYPFLEQFTNGNSLPEFSLVYTGVDAFGGKVELYRFQKSKA